MKASSGLHPGPKAVHCMMVLLFMSCVLLFPFWVLSAQRPFALPGTPPGLPPRDRACEQQCLHRINIRSERAFFSRPILTIPLGHTPINRLSVRACARVRALKCEFLPHLAARMARSLSRLSHSREVRTLKSATGAPPAPGLDPSMPAAGPTPGGRRLLPPRAQTRAAVSVGARGGWRLQGAQI